MLFMQEDNAIVAAWYDFNIKACFPLYLDLWDQKYSWEDVTDAADMGRYMEGQAWKSGNMSETIVNKMTYDGARTSCSAVDVYGYQDR